MTLREFKAWLEGYEESFGYSGPSSTQWAKVKEKLESVDEVAPYVKRTTPLGDPSWGVLGAGGTAVPQPVLPVHTS